MSDKTLEMIAVCTEWDGHLIKTFIPSSIWGELIILLVFFHYIITTCGARWTCAISTKFQIHIHVIDIIHTQDVQLLLCIRNLSISYLCRNRHLKLSADLINHRKFHSMAYMCLCVHVCNCLCVFLCVVQENDEFKTRDKRQRQQIEILEHNEKEIAKKNLSNQKIIRMLTEKCRG